MAEIPCPIKAPCLDDANPFVNLSSEGPDVNHFYAYGSGPGSINTHRTTGPGSVGPPPGGNWSDSCQSENGPITCEATTQADADLCVDRLAQECTSPDGTPATPPSTPSNQPLFSNQQQTCAAVCPDGTPFNYTVPAGVFVASSQILANRQANSYACRQAQLLKLCFSGLSESGACVNQSYSGTISVTGGSGFTFSITNGSLPPGVTMSTAGNGALFSGTPTTPGNYSFTLKVTNSQGNSISKNLTISVIAFTNADPTSYTVGSAYTFQFTASGGNLPYTFSIVAGALPTGLTMDTAGLVSGTPTAAGSSAISVQVTDANSHSCVKNYSLTESLVGFFVCQYAAFKTAILTDPFVCTASAFPEWDGVFNLQSAWSGGPLWYFINKAFNATAVAANEAPDYPAGDWQNLDSFTQLYYDTAAQEWHFWLVCVSGGLDVFYTLSSTNPNDPSGHYLKESGSGSADSVDIKAAGTAACPDWSKLTWTAPVFTVAGNGIASASFSGNSGQANVASETFPASTGSYVSGAVGSMNYSGCGCDCQINLTTLAWASDGFLSNEIAIEVLQDGNTLVSYHYFADANPGNVVIPFSVVAGSSSVIQVRGGNNIQGPLHSYVITSGDAPFTNLVSISFTITNV